MPGSMNAYANSEFMLNRALQGCPTEDGFVFVLVVGG